MPTYSYHPAGPAGAPSRWLSQMVAAQRHAWPAPQQASGTVLPLAQIRLGQPDRSGTGPARPLTVGMQRDFVTLGRRDSDEEPRAYGFVY